MVAGCFERKSFRESIVSACIRPDLTSTRLAQLLLVLPIQALRLGRRFLLNLLVSSAPATMAVRLRRGTYDICHVSVAQTIRYRQQDTRHQLIDPKHRRHVEPA